jgi:hypothetical protein
MSKEVSVVNKVGNNEKFDTDILKCKADIIRLRNIIPPHDDTASKNPETQDNSDAVEISTHKNAGPIPIETIPAKETAPLPETAVSTNKKEKEEVETSKETPEIPSFDLADEIMTEQRKITAIRRKAPGPKNEVQRLKPETRIVDHSIEQPKTLLSEQEKIIAEIVARDIEKLCRGNYSSK